MSRSQLEYLAAAAYDAWRDNLPLPADGPPPPPWDDVDAFEREAWLAAVLAVQERSVGAAQRVLMAWHHDQLRLAAEEGDDAAQARAHNLIDTYLPATHEGALSDALGDVPPSPPVESGDGSVRPGQRPSAPPPPPRRRKRRRRG